VKKLLLSILLLLIIFSAIAQKKSSLPINGKYGVFYNSDRSITFKSSYSLPAKFSVFDISKLEIIFETADKLANQCDSFNSLIAIKTIGKINRNMFVFKYSSVDKMSFVIIQFLDDSIYDSMVISRDSIEGDKKLFIYFVTKFRDLYYQKNFDDEYKSKLDTMYISNKKK
jgi:hypothetical protein